ncbi:MAG: DUF7556 family protein [Halodesulfurarchaeum sp.]
MVSDATSMARTDEEVMAAVDEAGSHSRFVIADITRDGAWVSAALADTRDLEAWR